MLFWKKSEVRSKEGWSCLSPFTDIARWEYLPVLSELLKDGDEEVCSLSKEVVTHHSSYKRYAAGSGLVNSWIHTTTIYYHVDYFTIVAGEVSHLSPCDLSNTHEQYCQDVLTLLCPPRLLRAPFSTPRSKRVVDASCNTAKGSKRPRLQQV